MENTLISTNDEQFEQLFHSVDDVLAQDIVKAVNLSQQALSLAEAQKNSFYTAKSQYYLDDLFRHEGDIHDAIRLLKSVVASTEDLNEDKLKADALHVMAIIYEGVGNYDISLEILLEALRIREAHWDSSGQARILNSMGIVFAKTGDHQKALYYYELSHSIQVELGDNVQSAMTLNNIGLSRKNLGHYTEARRTYADCIILFDSLGHALGQATARGNMAVVLGKLGHFSEAEHYFVEAQGFVNRAKSKAFLLEIKLDWGDLFVAQGDLTRAEEKYFEALALANELGAKATLYKVHKALAKVYKSQGKFEQALHHFESYYELEQAVHGEASAAKLEKYQMLFDLEQSRQEIEIHQLKFVELKKANEKLKKANTKLAKQTKQLARQTIEDGLTGIYNRRYLNQAADEVFKRAKRYRHNLSFALGDIDFFKMVNDKFSHAIGDVVLKTIAHLIKDNIRQTDVVARYGGEEFAIIFTGTKGEKATQVCEKVRQIIAEYPWHEIHPDLNITMSFGVSDDTSVDDYEALLNRADKKLYEAKRDGKNRVR